MMKSDQGKALGLLLGTGAFLMWGVFPFYFKLLQQVPATEILCHRIIWSSVFLGIIAVFRKNQGQWLKAAVAVPSFRISVLTSCLLAANWLTYIWAINHERLLQASLGYFLSPLFSMLFGIVVFREEVRPLQKVSMALACLGVLPLCVRAGEFPWVSLLLAVTFALYGMLRKRQGVDTLTGLFLETGILVPLTLLFFWTRYEARQLVFISSGTYILSLLALSGAITSIPLLFFVGATKRLNLVTIGFLQYISPSLQFIVAVFAFHEVCSGIQWVAFSLIWMALAIFTFDSSRKYRSDHYEAKI